LTTLTSEDFFFCYDRKLMFDLSDEGFKWITCAKHEQTDNKFFLFHRTDELEKAIEMHKNN